MTFNKSLHGSADRGPQATRVLTANLRENIEMIKKATGNSPDIIIREWRFEEESILEAVVIYASGLADVKFINQFIMEPLMSNQDDGHLKADRFPLANPLAFFKNKLLSVGEIKDEESADTLLNGILSGDTAILCQGNDHGLLIASKGWEERGVQEPTSQTVIRGPKEGFSENIATNIDHSYGEKLKILICGLSIFM